MAIPQVCVECAARPPAVDSLMCAACRAFSSNRIPERAPLLRCVCGFETRSPAEYRDHVRKEHAPTEDA
jgi:hypothetical protein